jgi:hypothetical protein
MNVVTASAIVTRKSMDDVAVAADKGKSSEVFSKSFNEKENFLPPSSDNREANKSRLSFKLVRQVKVCNFDVPRCWLHSLV